MGFLRKLFGLSEKETKKEEKPRIDIKKNSGPTPKSTRINPATANLNTSEPLKDRFGNVLPLRGSMKAQRKYEAKLKADLEKEAKAKAAQANTPQPKVAPVNASKPQAAPANSPNQNPDTSSFELEKRYGSISREAYSTGNWNVAKFRFKNLEKEGLIEASIALGQMAQMTDKMEALEHFRKAAAKGSAEGAWSVAALLGHSYKAEINGKDKEWYKYCLQAAQGGCSDAMNELGNMYNRINDYLGAYYWYQMATYYEHPQGMDGVNGIIKKYVDAGMPKLTPKIDGVRPNDAMNAIFILRVLTGQDRLDNDRMNAFRAFAMADDNEIMCLFIAQFFESVVKMDGNAKMGYQLAAHNNSIMGMKCLADMLMAGRGGERNMESAIDWYIAAADKEEKTACFIMGEISRQKDPDLADFFYSVAYRRGYEPALARLQRK